MSDTSYGFSDLECQIILAQIERRAKLRKEFMRLRSDPCQNSLEAGYVFDPAIQRFMSMKNTQLEFFQPGVRNIKFGILAIVLPMFTYGYMIWSDRTKKERDIRCGKLKYRDRLFKFQ